MRSFASLSLVPITAAVALSASVVWAQTYVETPALEDDVAAGTLPPVAERLPDLPHVTDVAASGREVGHHGGEINWLARRTRDIRIMNVYGYARLVGYDENFDLQPDILESIDVEDERVFTMHLRAGHRWSNGDPFTAEDFRYFWEEMELNEEISPYGPDSRLVVNEEYPTVTVIDETTIQYEWSQPNPEFLPALAGARPLYIYAPSTYLKQFHAGYAEVDSLVTLASAEGIDDWAGLHIRRSDLYDADNPDLPVLQPWMNTTAPPAERFRFVRNPYFHRVDSEGHQLPYLDSVTVTIAERSLIPAKTGAGESHLQSRSIQFDNYTFLQEAAERNDYGVRLWPTAYGSEIALYPNLNVADETWRDLIRDVRFRRALSMAIDRQELNQVLFFGLATPGINGVLPGSRFYDEARSQLYANYDLDAAGALLDEIGLTERNGDGIRLMPNGEPLDIIVETAGERELEIDALELIADSWRRIGVGVYSNPSSRDVFRNRIYAGEAAFSIWTGLDNALITAATVPVELAPVAQDWLQYPAWGQYVQTAGAAGVAPDLPFGGELMDLYTEWRSTTDADRRSEIIMRMLDIHAEEVTSIGTVQGVFQPIVVANALHNVPEVGVYSWDPGGHFGVYRPDLFWLDQ